MLEIGYFPVNFRLNNLCGNRLISGMYGKFPGLYNMFVGLLSQGRNGLIYFTYFFIYFIYCIFVTVNSTYVYERNSFLLLLFISVLSCNLKQIVEY